MSRIAVIPGDGIGREVVPEALRLLEALSFQFRLDLEFVSFPWGCEYYLERGEMMPPDGLEILSSFDAILLGAVGAPGVPDHVSLWGLLIPIRRTFHQYVNLRPVRLLPGIRGPLRDKKPQDIDFCIVRENSEGEYSEVGGMVHEGTEAEAVVQESLFTRKGITRIMRYAFGLAQKRVRKHLTSATKSNGIVHTMPYWDSVFQEISMEFADVETSQYHVDALAARMVLNPERFDVIVASNLFGDILSDLGPALAGSLGIAPSANLNPEKNFPSMFEPVHGSAPDIAGEGVANPTGQIWSTAMMLDHLGYSDAASAVERATLQVIAEGRVLTPDLGGSATTRQMGKAITRSLQKGAV
jgi:tartrate dehydrogenase/decarboxylase/D-malate dehydrogenase